MVEHGHAGLDVRVAAAGDLHPDARPSLAGGSHFGGAYRLGPPEPERWVLRPMTEVRGRRILWVIAHAIARGYRHLRLIRPTRRLRRGRVFASPPGGRLCVARLLASSRGRECAHRPRVPADPRRRGSSAPARVRRVRAARRRDSLRRARAGTRVRGRTGPVLVLALRRTLRMAVRGGARRCGARVGPAGSSRRDDRRHRHGRRPHRTRPRGKGATGTQRAHRRHRRPRPDRPWHLRLLPRGRIGDERRGHRRLRRRRKAPRDQGKRP